MVIKSSFGKNYFGNLVIANYPNLEIIVMKKNSLRYLNSLKICNNETLETIETEDGCFENTEKCELISNDLAILNN